LAIRKFADRTITPKEKLNGETITTIKEDNQTHFDSAGVVCNGKAKISVILQIEKFLSSLKKYFLFSG